MATPARRYGKSLLSGEMPPAKQEIPNRARLSVPMGGRTLCQAHVPTVLYGVAKKEWQKRKLTMRQVLVWCLSNFLLATNPEAAAKLGIYEKRIHKKNLPKQEVANADV